MPTIVHRVSDQRQQEIEDRFILRLSFFLIFDKFASVTSNKVDWDMKEREDEEGESDESGESIADEDEKRDEA